jgi:ornithine cyclodeaminase/alanine dehydrogenase-like protein (mu-crystallin family)
VTALARVPAFSSRHVYGAIDPGEAVDVVRGAFVEHARGAWQMPSKVYVECYPDGDFRAMPAAGGGYALLKWVTSFPGNPARGLPTVSGVVLLSDAKTGELRAIMDAAAVTAIRTGAAAVLAAETLARPGAGRAAIVGCGVNGRAAARAFLARGRDVLLHDARPEQAQAAAVELGTGASTGTLDEALACDVVVTVTPGHSPVFRSGTLRAGQHASLMGADGPGKSEIDIDELLRARIVCDEWAQASHNGDISHAVEAGRLAREQVAELGQVLIGTETGRRSEHEITVFDSTGLAVQDLAVAVAVYERHRAEPGSKAFAGLESVDLSS